MKGLSHGEHLRACLAEALLPGFDSTRWETAASSVSMVCCTDAKSVYDNVTGERGIPSDRMLALGLALLRETFGSQLREDVPDSGAALRWLPGPRNVADGLTKYLAQQDLMSVVLGSGQHSVAEDSVVAAAAASRKARRKLAGKEK